MATTRTGNLHGNARERERERKRERVRERERERDVHGHEEEGNLHGESHRTAGAMPRACDRDQHPNRTERI